MTFATLTAEASSKTDTASTSHTVDIPTGSGGFLLMAISTPGAPTLSGNDLGLWRLLGAVQDAIPDQRVAFYTRPGEGVSGTITVTSSVSCRSTHHVMRWAGAAPPSLWGIATAADVVDPPNLDPTGYGAEDFTWVPFVSHCNDGAVTDITGFPASYTGTGEISSAGTAADGTGLGWARRQLNASSENPGAFTATPGGSRAGVATIAIPPAVATGQVAFLAAGTRGTGTTTTTPTYPTGAAASGRLAVAHRSVKPQTATAASETGWVQQVNGTGGTGAASADAGQTRLSVDTDELAGGEGNPTFDQASTPNSVTSAICVFEKSPTSATWDMAFTTGDDTTHGTGRAATGAASLSLQPGDVVLAICASDTDSPTAFTSPAITASGITFGATTAILAPGGSGTGNDVGSHVWEATVISGTATVAPSLALTGGVAGGNCGLTAFARLRAVASSATDLVVDDATHGHTADAPALTQVHNLTVADAGHGHTGDAVALTQAHTIAAVDDTLHAHTAESPTITLATTLAVDDAAHGHTADGPSLTQAHALAVADALHGHAADSPALTQAHALAVADSSHAHAADSPSLTQAHVLAPDDTLHAHTADNVALSGAGDLAVADASHGHTADSPTLTQVHVLEVDSALHGHTADTPTLAVFVTLTVDDAHHAHRADHVSFATAPDDTDATLDADPADRQLASVGSALTLTAVPAGSDLSAVNGGRGLTALP